MHLLDSFGPRTDFCLLLEARPTDWASSFTVLGRKGDPRCNSRVCSAMCDKYSFLFLNKLLNNHRLKVPQWESSWPYSKQGPHMKPNMVAPAASPMVIQIQKPAFQILNPRALPKIPHENCLTRYSSKWSMLLT